MQKKYILVTLANYIPVLCGCLLFRGGAPLLWPLFIIMQILLVSLNYSTANGKLGVLFLNANLLVSTIAANWLFVYLYYTLISSDSETVIVGYVGGEIGAIFVLVLSLISVLIKALTGRKESHT